jgi:hypothetical protein
MAFPATEPNSNRHYAIGDICNVSGIKRAGAAMAMGRIVATNIFASLLRDEDPSYEFAYAEFPDVPPMMAIAIGKQAVTYGPSVGLKWGVEQLEVNFGHDLSWESTSTEEWWCEDRAELILCEDILKYLEFMEEDRPGMRNCKKK